MILGVITIDDGGTTGFKLIKLPAPAGLPATLLLFAIEVAALLANGKTKTSMEKNLRFI